MQHKPILITGSHRSGTTWVGKMIASSPGLGYVHEPFNLLCRPGTCDIQLQHWFAYAPDVGEADVYSALHDTLRFRYHAISELRACENSRDLLRMIRDFGQMTAYRYTSARPVVKDPIALFSAGWLADKFDMNVIVLIRHPAAFVSSLKVKHWHFPFEHLLQQEALMQTYFYSFRQEIQSHIDNEHDIIEQGILLWRLFHFVILEYQKAYPEWLFVRHEDISRNPEPQFRNIFEYLKLPFVPSVSQAIADSTSESNQKETSENIHFVKRNSESNIWNWQNRLTAEEIDQIRVGTSDIADAFYPPEDWQPRDSDLPAGVV